MPALEEKQYELDGVVFGLDCPMHVIADGWTPGSPESVTQDTPLPGDDGVRFGKDYYGSATWGFSLYSNGDDEVGGWSAVKELGRAWRADMLRKESGAVIPLRYRVAGSTRRVYGRPRRWTPSPGNASMTGRIDVTADFATVDHRFYGDDEKTTGWISIGQPADPDAGIIPPFIVPFTSIPPSSPRQTSFTVGGDELTPVWITFSGPLAAGRVQVGGWTAALRDPVIAGDNVTLDARPWIRAATKASGGGVRVNPRVTRMSQMLLPPGEHELIFTGTDPTGAAKVKVSWREAYSSPR